MNTRKVHLERIDSLSLLFLTGCGLSSSSRQLPYKMTGKYSDVTCRNCMRGLRPEKFDGSLADTQEVDDG